MNNDHEYLERMQTEYGAVIQFRKERQTTWLYWRRPWNMVKEEYDFRICPIWLEERFKEAALKYEREWGHSPHEEYEFKMGQTFYYIDISGGIPEDTWEGTLTDLDMYMMGNAYQTKEEAQVARDRQLARVRVERRIKELNGDWTPQLDNSDHLKFAIQYNNGLLLVHSFWMNSYTDISWLGTENTMAAVIHEMPEDIMLAMGGNSE